jgi:hypothetical protein
MGPLDLTLSQQMRLRRTRGSRAYDEVTKELRIELGAGETTPRYLLDLVAQVLAVPTEASS